MFEYVERHEETDGGGVNAYIHCLDCDDGLMVSQVYTRQNPSNCKC